jgi:hypothetical protein
MSCCTISGFLNSSQLTSIGRNHSVVFQEICKIQSALLSHFSCGNATSTEVIVAGNTPMTHIGKILEVCLVSGGYGYETVQPTLTVDDLSGTGAAFQVIADELGTITSVNVISSGSGYSVSPVYTLTHPTGTGALLELVVAAGEIASVSVISGGIDYLTYEPVAVVQGSGTGGSISWNINSVFSFENLSVLSSGFGYSTDTVVNFVPAINLLGTGASATLKLDSDGFNTNSNLYYRQFTGIDDNILIQDQLNSVLGYFRNLGYAIDILVNPETMSTIMWKVSI